MNNRTSWARISSYAIVYVHFDLHLLGGNICDPEKNLFFLKLILSFKTNNRFSQFLMHFIVIDMRFSGGIRFGLKHLKAFSKIMFVSGKGIKYKRNFVVMNFRPCWCVKIRKEIVIEMKKMIFLIKNEGTPFCFNLWGFNLINTSSDKFDMEQFYILSP